MFGPPGRAYVYRVYGLHHCMNVVTGPEGFPAAVLIRAAEPVEGCLHSTRGPGNLCRALRIEAGVHTGADLATGPVWIEDAPRWRGRVIRTPRIGVAFAGPSARHPWRFVVAASEWASGPRFPLRVRRERVNKSRE
jgi:DNA-3-methyladenine glycosylase